MNWSKKLGLVAGVVAVGAAGAVFFLSASKDQESFAFTQDVTPAAMAAPQAKSMQVSRDGLGSDWPFTVDAGTLTCGAGGDISFAANGQTYAVNQEAARAHQNLNPIWARDASGKKASLYEVISQGKSLC